MIPETDWNPKPSDIAWQRGLVRVLQKRARWAVPGSTSVFRIDKQAQHFALVAGNPDHETNRRIAKVFRLIGYSEVSPELITKFAELNTNPPEEEENPHDDD